MPRIETRIKYNGRSVAPHELKAIYDKKRKKLNRAIHPAMKKVSIMLDQWVQKNFATQGGLVGGWKKITRDGMILQDTGVLKHSFLPFYSKKDAGIGSDLEYAEKHEKGIGVKKRRILPKRKDVIKTARKIIKDTIKTAGK
jgi:phage gpG-like protein